VWSASEIFSHPNTVWLSWGAPPPPGGGRAPHSAQDPSPVILEVTTDIVTEPFYQKTNTGQFGEEKLDDGITRTYGYAGDDAKSSFDLKNEHFDTSNLRAQMSYDGGNFGGLLRFNVDRRSIGSGSTISVSDLIDLYYAWVKIPIWSELYVKLWTGIDAYRGGIARYADFDDFTRGRLDNFGPVILGYDATTRLINMTESDITNMQKDAAGAAAPTVLLDIGYTPATLTLSTSQLYYTIRDAKYPSASGGANDIVAGNFGIRLEGAKLFNMLTLAGIYKHSEYDQNFDDTRSVGGALTETRDQVFGGKGLKHHLFGFYTTVTPLEGLGITAGYSGYIKQQEDGYDLIGGAWTQSSRKWPVYHGIDLRAQYDGIPGLKITTSHNVSFSRIAGDDDPTTFIAGYYNENIPADTTEGSFVLYNSLAAAYTILDGLTVRVEAANRHGRLYYNYDDLTHLIDTYNVFSLYAGVNWQITQMVSLRGGFALRYDDYTSAAAAGTAKAGIQQIGVPLAIKVVF
jgi:hypothetical protein